MIGEFPPIAKTVDYFERGLAEAKEFEDPERTAFVQLTLPEVVLVQYGLFWLAELYGKQLVSPFIEKFHDILSAQEFCQCRKCQQKRKENECSDSS